MVSYIIEKSVVVAFGSAGYYRDENYYTSDNRCQLWIEGMVSTVKGCGSLILRELEQALMRLSKDHNVEIPLINVMSVEESVGFYETQGYLECKTSPRFRGTGNIRCVKSCDGFSLASAKLISDSTDDEYFGEYLSTYLLQGRRTQVNKYLNVPGHVGLTEMAKYVFTNSEQPGLFKEPVVRHKEILLSCLEEFIDIQDQP